MADFSTILWVVAAGVSAQAAWSGWLVWSRSRGLAEADVAARKLEDATDLGSICAEISTVPGSATRVVRKVLIASYPAPCGDAQLERFVSRELRPLRRALAVSLVLPFFALAICFVLAIASTWHPFTPGEIASALARREQMAMDLVGALEILGVGLGAALLSGVVGAWLEARTSLIEQRLRLYAVTVANAFEYVRPWMRLRDLRAPRMNRA